MAFMASPQTRWTRRVSAGGVAVAMYRVPHSSQRKGSNPNSARGRSNHRRRERWASGLRQDGHRLPNGADDGSIASLQKQEMFSRGSREQARNARCGSGPDGTQCELSDVRKYDLVSHPCAPVAHWPTELDRWTPAYPARFGAQLRVGERAEPTEAH